MTEYDVMKIQSIIGAGELLRYSNENTVKAEQDFMSVAMQEYEAVKELEAYSDSEIDKLWEEYKNSADFEFPKGDSIIDDKAEERALWEKYTAMQTKKRKMIEEMLIKRRLFELERIATGGGKFGDDSLPYLEGVSAAELLSGLI